MHVGESETFSGMTNLPHHVWLFAPSQSRTFANACDVRIATSFHLTLYRSAYLLSRVRRLRGGFGSESVVRQNEFQAIGARVVREGPPILQLTVE